MSHRRFGGSILTTATVMALQLALVASANAVPGALDTTFGGDGKVTTRFMAGAGAEGVAIQANGKIVAAGLAGEKFALARYNRDGTLDSTFGGSGRVTTRFTVGSAFARDVAIQGDGKIVAGGDVGLPGRFALARYNRHGSLDATFGGDGKVITRFMAGSASAEGVAIQANGKIVAAGLAGDGRFALARYLTNGTLDTTFGGDGKVTTRFIVGSANAFDVAIQQDGKIVVAGTAGGRFALARYNHDGTLDVTFGGDGRVITRFTSGAEGARGVAIQGDGKIVAAGYISAGLVGGFGEFALARYDTDGTLDTTFDGDGKVTTDLTPGLDYANDVAIQQDGRIVAAGFAADVERFGLARYEVNGALDTTFSGDGEVTTNFTPGFDEADGVAIQGNGKIVAVGGAGGRFALARYLGA
jgi:uncharacterized delta-60 repeat protein